MSFVPLAKLLDQWKTKAQSVNVHILAISAIIKKLAILSMENEIFNHDDKVKKFVHFSITERFNKLLTDLDSEWTSIVSLDFVNSLTYAIEIAEIEMKKNEPEYEESDSRKTDIEFANIVLESVDELVRISLIDTIIEICEAAKSMSKQSIVSDMLEDKLELRFTLPLLHDEK